MLLNIHNYFVHIKYYITLYFNVLKYFFKVKFQFLNNFFLLCKMSDIKKKEKERKLMKIINL